MSLLPSPYSSALVRAFAALDQKKPVISLRSSLGQAGNTMQKPKVVALG